ncbi:hypothetical protein HA1_02832 [Clostridium perfringens F262]|uniref:Uncharacterized protein n=1 Tax=Clostridium perfringens F262 TaxID=883064 RepID=A0AAV3FGM3_CLOPF|nr:hypothetical protein HA1_02832 [Clostridium perfringens F262]
MVMRLYQNIIIKLANIIKRVVGLALEYLKVLLKVILI